jgi:deoxyribodipyrimidine photolyase-related protein
MRAFQKRLSEVSKRAGFSPSTRRSFFVPYDQLTDEVGPLAAVPARDRRLVFVESLEKPTRRPYHQQKLALLLANQRQFALEQAALGADVRVLVGESYGSAIESVTNEHGALEMMEGAERELRVELEPLVASGRLRVHPHAGFLTTTQDFDAACPEPPYRMDAFYRQARRKTGWLLEKGKPVGGKWSHDADNRKAWRGEPPAATPPTFEPDAVTQEVVELVRQRYRHHPGSVDVSSLPTTRTDAERLWAWAKRACLPSFGPFEDAMSTHSTTLFHTRISALLNLHRLLPRQVCEDVVAMDLPVSSREGFVRQVLGWREFVRHVHRATDGFRRGPGSDPAASPSALGAREPLPEAFWGRAESGLACLDHVVASVWGEAYGHHITRLMILANLATLLDVDPRALTDWFWVAYADAYDWVVEPNVLGMGTYAVADLMTTKPYVSGAGYIDKMSDYCRSCRFDPKRTCPITPLYWAFLERHRAELAGNPRLFMPMNALKKRAAAQKVADATTYREVRAALTAGEPLSPKASPQ